ncbi:MAG: S41 family peptidase [Defluviitaleaceae bacterium]|nr:S41 family peptidase [Defluviitaleaceae bacterium]
MKKLILGFVLFAAVFGFTSCDYADQRAAEYLAAGVDARVLPFLLDFEYMVLTLEENFPYFGIAERRFGVQSRTIIENTYRALIDNNVQNARDFQRVVNRYFMSPMRHIGHLSFQDAQTLHLIMGNIYRGPINYNGQPLDLGEREFTYWGYKFRQMVHSDAVRGFYGDIIVTEGYETGMVRPGNVTTEIIDGEAGIAYIRVSQFRHYNIEHDKAIIFDFYEQIKGFEHLILDFRSNPGGFTRYFIELFMAPNIAEDLEIYVYTMLMGGEYNRGWFGAEANDARHFGRTYLQKHAAREYMAGRFEHMNSYDAQFLDYILARPVLIHAVDENIAFDGKIWILVNQSSASAVEYAVLYAQAANFATVVGSNTRGVTGGGFAGFFALPRTGLVIRYDLGYFIDNYGRAIDEFGVRPDHFNKPGLDALATVLEMIVEN